jgi:oxygen-independent coproporphyrinogen-3 oxidase
MTQEVAEARGLPAYEISNHAAPSAESRHNLTYWRYRDYVGVGPGAHGRLALDGVKHATMSERHPERWLELAEKGGHGLVTDDVLTLEECADEMLLMGLRLREGIRIDRYEAMCGRRFSGSRLAFLQESGFRRAVRRRAASRHARRLAGARFRRRRSCRLSRQSFIGTRARAGN